MIHSNTFIRSHLVTLRRQNNGGRSSDSSFSGSARLLYSVPLVEELKVVYNYRDCHCYDNDTIQCACAAHLKIMKIMQTLIMHNFRLSSHFEWSNYVLGPVVRSF